MKLEQGQIIILTEDSKPNRGGIAEFLREMAMVLAQHYDVRIISSCQGASSFSRPPNLIYEEIKWFRPQIRMRGDSWTPLRKINTLRWMFIRKNLAKKKLFQLVSEKKTYGVLLFRLSAVMHPWCQACRELGISYTIMAYGKELIEKMSPVNRGRLRHDLHSACHIFTISRATRDCVLKLGAPEASTTVIGIGIMPELYPLSTKEKLKIVREERGLSAERFIFSLCYYINGQLFLSLSEDF